MQKPTPRDNPEATVIILFGVSGSGKTTIGKKLARRLNYPFIEGDHFHSKANKAKMHSGMPLTDEDRWPWLARLRQVIAETVSREGHAILACSALSRAYWEYLDQPGVRFVYLKGDRELLHERLEERRGHFFDPDLLGSQLDTLEEPEEGSALTVDVAETPETIVRTIVESLGLEGHFLRSYSLQKSDADRAKFNPGDPARGQRRGSSNPKAGMVIAEDSATASTPTAMPQGDKSSYTSKQKRQAEHIEKGYRKRGVKSEEAERRAWATVNKSTGGGKKSGSGRGKKVSKTPARKGGKIGGRAASKKK